MAVVSVVNRVTGDDEIKVIVIIKISKIYRSIVHSGYRRIRKRELTGAVIQEQIRYGYGGIGVNFDKSCYQYILIIVPIHIGKFDYALACLR